MTQEPEYLRQLTKDILDLRLAQIGLVAAVASLPDAADLDIEKARRVVGDLVDPAQDTVANDQIARAMHFVQSVRNRARARQGNSTAR